MKTTNRFFIALTAMLLLLSAPAFSQDDAAAEAPQPQYYTVTTMHWNMNYEDFNMDTWKAVEKEFFDNVTMKNEYLMGASTYLHHTTPDNSELLVVGVYASWDDIDKAAKRNGELIREHWADSSARSAYFEKRNAYYANEHSDEIYATMPGAKYLAEPPTDGMLLYLRKSHFAFPKNGSQKEFMHLRDGYIEHIINKNELIKGWYPGVHAYGADRTESIEAYFFDNMTDLDNHFAKNAELAKAAWPDDKERNERGKKARKYFTGVHGDYIYTIVGELTK